MPTITLYTKPNCPLCDHARYALQTLLAAAPGAWGVDEVNILDDQDLYAAYRYLIPVVAVEGGPALHAPESLDVARLRVALAQGVAAAQPAPLAVAAGAGSGQATAAAPAPAPAAPAAVPPGPGVPAGYPYPYAAPSAPARGILGWFDRLGRGLDRHWLATANTMVGIFITLPWLAPVFAALGWWRLANPIYTAYMFFCHQLPERAGYLFGYQAANCFRDDAIYVTVFVMGLLYARARTRGPGGPLAWMRTPIRLQTFALLITPMAVDGMTHLLGLRDDNAWFDMLTGGVFGSFSVGDAVGTLNWWLRIITGALFGFALVRLIYPWVQVAFDESRTAAQLTRARAATLDRARPATST